MAFLTAIGEHTHHDYNNINDDDDDNTDDDNDNDDNDDTNNDNTNNNDNNHAIVIQTTTHICFTVIGRATHWAVEYIRAHYIDIQNQVMCHTVVAGC